MNKRKLKKRNKKLELFAISFVSSYRELKEQDRSYHEYVLREQRRKQYLKQHNVKPVERFEF